MRLQTLVLLVCQALACQALVLPSTRARAPPSTMSIIERPDSALFCLNVCLRIKPERREEFLECIRANQEGTLTTEPLAVTYVYGEDELTPNTWRFFEQYVGKEGFEAHTKTAHFAAWEAFASTEPFSAPPEVRFFVEDSSKSVCAGAAAVREVLAEGDFTKLFCLDVQMSVKPESRDAFLAALRADQQGALTSEPLAVSYLFGEDTETANVFHMFEAYSGGRDGFAAHSQTPHYARWAEFKATEPFSAPAKVGYYEVYLGVPGP
mmetsp:Transcript_10534/g.21342  ORF Transcript_10534/g.21342 Transcript_10534/m.21342 type:complete len:265 (-) Transcript_10534:79-873(-)